MKYFRLDSARNFLHLIEYNKSVLGRNFGIAEEFEPHNNSFHVQIRRKKFFHHRIGIKIYIYGFFKRCFAEFIHQPGFVNTFCIFITFLCAKKCKTSHFYQQKNAACYIFMNEWFFVAVIICRIRIAWLEINRRMFA